MPSLSIVPNSNLTLFCPVPLPSTTPMQHGKTGLIRSKMRMTKTPFVFGPARYVKARWMSIRLTRRYKRFSVSPFRYSGVDVRFYLFDNNVRKVGKDLDVIGRPFFPLSKIRPLFQKTKFVHILHSTPVPRNPQYPLG